MAKQGYAYIEKLETLLTEIPPGTIVSRTLHEDDAAKSVLFGFAAGQSLSEHTAAMPAILHFLQGEADLRLGDQALTAGPGTWVHMDANLPHSITARRPTLMLLHLLKAKG